MNQKSKNYYQILGVDSNASPEQIRSMYKRLAKKYHADANIDDPILEKWSHERMAELNEAYSVLKDPDLRKQYDKEFHAYHSEEKENFIEILDYEKGVKELHNLVDIYYSQFDASEYNEFHKKKTKELIKKHPKNYLRLSVPHAYSYSYLNDAVISAFIDATEYFKLKIKRVKVYYFFSISFLALGAYQIFKYNSFDLSGIIALIIVTLIAGSIFDLLCRLVNFIFRGLQFSINKFAYIIYGSIGFVFLVLAIPSWSPASPSNETNPLQLKTTPVGEVDDYFEEKAVTNYILKNESSEKIDVAVSYLNKDGNVVTEGWWVVEPYGNTELELEKPGDKLYLYATSSNNSLIWDGRNNANSTTNPVRINSKRFEINGNISGFDGIKYEHFYPININESGKMISLSPFDKNCNRYYNLSLENRCYESISVAVHYQGLKGDWITTGWFILKPDETLDTGLKFQNKHVYFFAESNTYKWSKDSRNITRTVTSDRFTIKNNSGLEPNNRNIRNENFFERQIGINYGTYTHFFTCD
ncbi:DnaJ domain-containing protein [Salinimicrobium xinjiangense]|uniref:DnaJ domain-containing protein n=1 Tax=Salinimicrobium xinjiangense TaxID=438596 RepID=UPI00040F62DB|nr:DnaJ domain-containing protein [Salinimicrobium xinjiangense]